MTTIEPLEQWPHCALSIHSAGGNHGTVTGWGARQRVRIDKAILPNWVGERTNTSRLRRTPTSATGAAREFFYPQQDARHNKITEASNLLLHDHYCLLPDDVRPTFGDYLNVPNIHAGRYILKDPTSGRDISFSVQSGGNAPYRFYWVDEDFSVQPFGHSPDPDVFRPRIDVWRRCA